VREQDFYDLTYAYLERAAAQGIRHAEIFFDPQSHTGRGIPFETVITGIHRALQDGDQTLHVSSGLILCFLRHLSEDAALQTLTEAMPFTEWLIGVGLDSSELGRPPSMFEHVYQRASELGLHAVAHAGEEGPPDYISEALDLLGAERIDHGVRCLEDERLVDRLVEEQVPLTVCPLSNVKLRVFPELRQHNLNRMLARGLRVTINSDDPAYFGGYLLENLHETATALRLTPDDLLTLARNSFRASFISDQERTRYLGEIDRVANQPSLNTIS
jgi:adenosine deaminase